MYQNSDEHISNVLAARELALKVSAAKHQQKLAEYNSNPSLCVHCSKPLEYKKRRNKFCGNSCSASHNNTGRELSIEHRRRISETAKKSAAKGLRRRRTVNASTVVIHLPDGTTRVRDARLKVCNVCGKEYHPQPRRYNQSIVCSPECRIAYNRLPEQVERVRQKAIERVNNGTHKGWHSRANRAPSYPERYFIDVFTNEGIEFEREVKCGRFFIDFVVGDLAIEIDGAQHEYPEYQERDRRKDEYLTSNGYQVIRIKWYNPSNPVKRERLYAQIKELKLAIMQQKQRCRDESLDV